MEDGIVLSAQRIRDGLRELLPEFGIFNPLCFVWVRQIATFNQHGGAMLAVQHVHEPRPAYPAVLFATCAQQRGVQPRGQLQVLHVEGVVGERLHPRVGITAGESGRHANWREALGFEAGRFFIRRAGIKMQTDEQISVMRFGERDTI